MKKFILLGSVIVASNLLAWPSSVEDATNYATDTTQETQEQIQSHIQNMFNFSITSDNTPTDVCNANNEQCFNAGININSSIHIQTKIAGVSGGFQLKIRHRKSCGWGWHNHIGVVLVDNLTGKIITEPKEIDPNITPTDDPTNPSEEFVSATFNVANAYKNVSVRFLHLKPNECNHHQFRWMHQLQENVQNMGQEQSINDIIGVEFMLPNSIKCYEVNQSNVFNFSNLPYWGEEINCDTDATINLNKNISEIKDIINDKKDLASSWHFKYAVPANDTCYTVQNECGDSPYIAQSSDNFAIRPSYFSVELPSHIQANTATPIRITVRNASDEIITNYNNSSTNLNVVFRDNNGQPLRDANGNPVEAQYSFDIRDGIGSGRVIFPSAVQNNGVRMIITDENFANIDIPDTNVSLRYIDTNDSNSSTSDVSGGGSKYWAGAGTNESENNPSKNSINADIKQNVKKDLHYQKMGW